jgi:hypothetical protein
MNEPRDLGRSILDLAVRAFEPLEIAGSDPRAAAALVDLTGWDLSVIAGFGPGELGSAAETVARSVDGIRETIEGLGEDEPDIATVASVLVRLTEAGGALYQLGDGWTPPTDLPADLPALFLEDLVGHLAVLAAGRYHPMVRSVLDLLGVLAYEDVAVVARGDGAVLRPARAQPRLNIGALGGLFTNPANTILGRYGLTGPNRLPADDAADRLFPAIAAVLRDGGLLAWHGDPGTRAALTTDQQEVLDHSLRVVWTHSVDPASGGIATLDAAFALRDDGAVREVLIVPSGSLAVGKSLDTWSAGVALSGQAGGIVVRTDGVRFVGIGTHLGLEASVQRPVGPTPLARLGAPDGPRIQLGGAAVRARVDFGSVAGGVDVDGGFMVELRGLQIVVGAAPGDGFLGSLLPAEGLDASCDLALTWTPDGGVELSGSAALDIVLALDLELGPLTLDALQLGVRAGEQGLTLLTTVSATLRLGPVTAVAERVGLRGRLAPGANGSGGARLDVGFQPPSGIGLVVAAGPVTGGGYLFIDPEAGTYAGVAQLQFKALALTAIGLINTRLPGGRPGWSFLILVAVEFPGVPLGFGISLYAVGGLVGVNRSVNVSRLRDAVRAGRLDSVLFPRDPVANATQVLGDLAALFPTELDRVTIGVMVRLGWLPGPLVTLDAGLILEIPSPVRLAVLARLRAILPTAEAALVRLRLDVVGIIDFGRGEASIDGALIDSRVGPFSIAGEMALRASWGASQTFALAAGGFHPRYPVPEGFPTLRRLTIGLADSENPRLRLETYLALTTATVQVGARLEVFVEQSILGRLVTATGVLGFDALIRFLPRFGFEVDIYGSVTIAVDGDPWLSAGVFLHLTGTAPWQASGEVRVKLGFLPEVTVRAEVTAGDPDSSVPISGSVTVRLVEDLSRPEAIVVLPAPSALPGVVLRQPAEAERAVHPGGRVAVRQRTVPFGPRISRFGGADPTDPGSYGIDVTLGGARVTGPAVLEPFSASQFAPENPERAVGRPEFESFPAGAQLTSVTNAVASNGQRVGVGTDDRVIGPTAASATKMPVAATPASVANAWAGADADRVAAAPAAPDRFQARMPPARLRVHPERWNVADPDTLRPLRLNSDDDSDDRGRRPRPIPRPLAPMPAMQADELADSHRAAGRQCVVAPAFEAALP